MAIIPWLPAGRERQAALIPGYRRAGGHTRLTAPVFTVLLSPGRPGGDVHRASHRKESPPHTVRVMRAGPAGRR